MRRHVTIAAAVLAGAAALTGCGDNEDRYVPTGVDGDYELACYDTQTNLYVDDDLCEDGHAVGHYAPIWYPMPYGSSHGHGYTDHYPGRRVDPHGRTTPPSGNVRVHHDGARVSVYERGRQAGKPVKVSADAAKVSSVSRSGSVSSRSRSGDRSWSGGSGKSSGGFSSGSRSSGRR